jgi:DNA-binding NtrC family response regulator
MDQETKEIIGNAFISMNLIGQSPCFQTAIRNIRLISEFDVGVHIYGETGTGKELAARAIHYLSARRNRPFIPISCGGLSDELILNELFGHARGAYTGADTKQPGVIQVADKGTLFIDEIDCLAPKAQIGLLRFLQEKEFKSLGSPEIRKVDTRIISASNRDLMRCVEAGIFRRDLYYRLDVLRLDLPPLRHRGGDVFLLAGHFLRKFTHEYGLPDQPLSPDIERKLQTHNWPGNVRELENFILKSCLMPKPLVSAGSSDTPDGDRHVNDLMPAEPIDIREGFSSAKARIVNRFEKRYLHMLLAKTRGNVSLAARIAKKERRTFTRLLKKHAIHRVDYLQKKQPV